MRIARRANAALIDGCGAPTVHFSAAVNLTSRCITLNGELDVGTAHKLHDVATMLVATRPGDCQLDVSGLTFIDAAGLGQVVQLANLLATRGAALAISGATSSTRRVFSIASLEQLLPVA